MTGNPEIDEALADMQDHVDRLDGATRRLSLRNSVAIVAAVLSVLSVLAVGVDVNHSADKRAELRCTETIDRTEAISEAIQETVDDVMDAIAEQVATDPDTSRAVDLIHQRVDRRLSVRLSQIPKC